MNIPITERISPAEAERLCIDAAIAAGASAPAAESIARAAVAAEAEGQLSVGLAHFIDYLDALEAGRIDGTAAPLISRPAPAVILSDAGGGTAHLGFDMAFDDLVAAAESFGVAIFSQRNAYTAGALGYFVGRLAERGLVGLAATSGPALLAGSGTTKPVFCTNPIAFAAPLEGTGLLVIDQASSATAFVNIRAAAERGDTIPEGWALGPDGKPTSDPSQAMKGALLAFGGERGANIALMVEVLAAGLSGSNWSLDAPSFTQGARSPGSGLFVAAIDPKLFTDGFARRTGRHIDRLSADFGLYVPGRTKAKARLKAEKRGLEVSVDTLRRIRSKLP
ncbi:Ldh family oxidoreductase [Mesorhizobium australicum]|uniref:(2R)-3-sulfolactate dehydrogenase (NADP+) n=1 Tax=Mesorhizobium australicum TaxID=536018 RepID=A0A1X7MYU7_9HYPH|nr:Ldh family oxidoreductase [Mesorhizobium australicum]SMH29207.1 (2R)-3-sulfolactate dehydrogenase (NADP+) [Mesorhizobium australicum]